MKVNKSLYDFANNEKPKDEMSFEYDSKQGDCTVEIIFKNKGAELKMSGAVNKTSRNSKVLPHKKRDTDVLSLKHRYDSNGNEISDLGLDVDDDVLTEFEQKLENHKEAVEQWEQEAQKRAENTDLKFEVVEHDYQTGTWRTKYDHTDIVLKPNKEESVRTEDENEFVEALTEKFDEADGYPIAPDRFDEGDVLTNVDFDVNQQVQKIREEKSRQKLKQDIIDQYDELRGVDFDSHDFMKAKRHAEETGEKQVVAEGHSDCNDRSAECNLDLITHYITPDNEIEVERVHTY